MKVRINGEVSFWGATLTTIAAILIAVWLMVELKII